MLGTEIAPDVDKHTTHSYVQLCVNSGVKINIAVGKIYVEESQDY